MPLKWNERPDEKEKIRRAPGQREESSFNINRSPQRSLNQEQSVKQLVTSALAQVGNATVNSLRNLASV